MEPQDLIDLSMFFFWFAFGVYSTYWFFGFFGKKVRFFALLTGIVLQLTSITLRGIAIDYFPLTNKFESFASFAVSTFIILLIYSRVESKTYRIILYGIGYAFLLASLKFPKGLSYAPPLMLTIWYPLHVPLSFFCYALWTSSMAAGIAWFFSNRKENVPYTELIDDGFLYGLVVFSISMIFGGLWGYVAWGSYFLWDPKVLWSVIVWFFYATCIHIDYWSALSGAKRLKPSLSIIGFLIMLTTYVGTSFFTASSHRF